MTDILSHLEHAGSNVSEDAYVKTERSVGNRVVTGRNKLQDMKVMPTGGSTAQTLADLAAVAAGLSAAEAGVLDGVTPGTGLASKALVLDASGNVTMPAAGNFALSRASVAAAGTDATNATVLTAQVNAVTASDGAKGVALPTAATTAGPVLVINTVGTANLLVYPVNGGNDQINALAEDAAYTLGPGRGAWFVPTSGTQWYTAAETISEQIFIPAAGAAKLGGSGAGWAIDGDNALPLVTLPASQTSEVLLIPAMAGLFVGDIVTEVGVCGQVEAAGNNVTLALDVRKVTAAAADFTDASIGTDNVGTLTADTEITAGTAGANQAQLAAGSLTETLAANEFLYATLTGTTGASTDIAIAGLVVTVTRRIR
jgi:hypothetical protein